MHKFKNLLADSFVKGTGYAYSNMGRLFLRLFVGVMFFQFGIRQLLNFQSVVQTFPSVMGMGNEVSLIVMIVIELLCSLLIMVGFMTRLATIPPIITMIIAEHYILTTLIHTPPYSILDTQPGYLPVMFIGIYCFILLAGPGKISLDYFISLFIINRRGRDEKAELEEV